MKSARRTSSRPNDQPTPQDESPRAATIAVTSGDMLSSAQRHASVTPDAGFRETSGLMFAGAQSSG